VQRTINAAAGSGVVGPESRNGALRRVSASDSESSEANVLGQSTEILYPITHHTPFPGYRPIWHPCPTALASRPCSSKAVLSCPRCSLARPSHRPLPPIHFNRPFSYRQSPVQAIPKTLVKGLRDTITTTTGHLFSGATTPEIATTYKGLSTHILLPRLWGRHCQWRV
jgi:hypothetical protein